MADEPQKPSQVDAVPGSGTPKPQSPEPGKAPKASEADAKPDKPEVDEANQ